jgi:hypothetical protein
VGQELLGIFENCQFEPSPFKTAFQKIKKRLRSGTKSFSSFLALSLFLHIFLFAFIAFFLDSLTRPNKNPAMSQVKPILNALSQLRNEQANQPPGQTKISAADEARIIEILTQTPLFDPRLSERDQTELSQKLVDSYLEARDKDPSAGVPPKLSLRDLLSLLPEESNISLSTGDKVYSPGRFGFL